MLTKGGVIIGVRMGIAGYAIATPFLLKIVSHIVVKIYKIRNISKDV